MIGSYSFEIIEKPEESRTEYWFTTENDLVYYAYLISSPAYLPEFEAFEYLSQYGYMIGFAPYDDSVLEEKQRHDPLIGPTICSIIVDFMQRFEKIVLVYHCDSVDGRQRQRNITFSKWFASHPEGKNIIRDKIHLQIEQRDGNITHEYLGYFATCPTSEIEIVNAEFAQFAREKVAAGKQPA